MHDECMYVQGIPYGITHSIKKTCMFVFIFQCQHKSQADFYHILKKIVAHCHIEM